MVVHAGNTARYAVNQSCQSTVDRSQVALCGLIRRRKGRRGPCARHPCTTDFAIMQ